MDSNHVLDFLTAGACIVNIIIGRNVVVVGGATTAVAAASPSGM